MKYNDLPNQGKEEVRQLLKAQFFKYYDQDVHGLLFESAIKVLNPDVTLFVDLKIVDTIKKNMVEMDNQLDEGLLDIDVLNNKEIIVTARNPEVGNSISDDPVEPSLPNEKKIIP